MNANTILNTHFGLLKNHAELVGLGIESPQATKIIFTNEQDQAELRERFQKSACCRDEVYYIDTTSLCCTCGNICDQY